MNRNEMIDLLDETICLFWNVEPEKMKAKMWEYSTERNNLRHLRWMLQKARDAPENEAQKIIGFVQGYIWAEGAASQENMQGISF